MKAKKKKEILPQSKVDYSTGPAYEAKSKSRQVVDKMYDAKGGNKSGLESKLTMDADGNYIRKSVDSSPAYSKGGKVKSRVNEAGNYTKPGLRKRLFEAIKAGSKGGDAGEWSARKAQLLALKYKKAGGGDKD